MILVGATGVMSWVYREWFLLDGGPFSLGTLEDALDFAGWVERLTPCLAVWSMAVLVVTLRGPRPSLRRLSRRPGFVAVLTVSLVVVTGLPIGIMSDLAIRAAQGIELQSFDPGIAGLYQLGNLPPRITTAVTVAWLVQAMTRRWRPDPGWPDRLGRLTGFAWIALIPVHELAGVGCLGS
jgi:hypothetical protein